MVADEELRRAGFRSADDGNQAVNLFARDQAQHAAVGAGEHGPVGIFLFADLAGVFEHKDGAGLHLFRDPLVQNVEFSDHVSSACRCLP